MSGDRGDLPDVAWLVALASLPAVGPARLAALLDGRPAREAFEALVAGRLVADGAFASAVRRADPRALVAEWRAAAAVFDVRALWDRHVAAGIAVLTGDGPGWPDGLRQDPDPPALLFARGRPDVLAGPRVAVVGTRRCSRYGWDVAYRLGAELAEAGVAVVSGLALGIDGAAHRGALDAAGAHRGALDAGASMAGGALDAGAAHRSAGDAGASVAGGVVDAGAVHRGALDAGAGHRRGGAGVALGAADSTGVGPPIGVVGTGLDVVYPRANRGLWDEVAAAGVLVGEAPLGSRAERWRFPARNRIIAGLADVVVVVESAEHGGAMHTVDEALRRDRTVLAVPGPITSPTSAGTNKLLRDVAAPVCGTEDVLVALGLSPTAHREATEQRPAPEGGAEVVLAALGWTPATFDDLAARSGLGLGEVAAAIALLAATGWITQDGPWIERVLRGTDITV